jgi:ElaB/YqjD/DUF883 family membrane-anchored ribosome-binding protein
MDTTILQTIADRIKNASGSGSKEIRLSINDANELLAVIAWVSSKENQELRAAIQQLMKMQQTVGTIHVSGGKFKN